jgi:hypothetical protein
MSVFFAAVNLTLPLHNTQLQYPLSLTSLFIWALFLSELFGVVHFLFEQLSDTHASIGCRKQNLNALAML